MSTRRSRPEQPVKRPERPVRPSSLVRPTRSPRPADPVDYERVRPATRAETMPITMMALVAAFVALAVSSTHGYTLLYGDAVAHLGIARGILDTATPGLATLGSVWLPLPHLLMLPFVWKLEWWQNGLAGAWPSMLCFVLSAAGMYRLARRLLPPGWAIVATAFFALNANLLYLSGTAMTEPLFLALMVWIVLVTLELRETLSAAVPAGANAQQILLGILIWAATMTRYDGWILGFAVWLVIAWQVLRTPTLRRAVIPGFLALSVLSLIGPLSWFWYNQTFGHDWLDFMRGPYSAAAIDRRTSPPGSHHHFGWHDPLYSLVLYARAAQVDAAAWETGWLAAVAAVWGAWLVARRHVWHFATQALTLDPALLLLWVPLPFYIYSIAYGSVPIFIPQLYPNSYYNSRYGLEMLPCLAIFGVLAAVWLSHRLAASPGKPAQLAAKLAQPVALLAVVINLAWMTWQTPLVLKEAMVNSRGRLALEVPMAEQLAALPAGTPVLIDKSAFVGALQTAGMPLRQAVGPADYYGWRDASADPAAHARYVFAADGDAIAAAVKAHPDGLTEQSILCTTNQPCVRIYQSTRYPGAK